MSLKDAPVVVVQKLLLNEATTFFLWMIPQVLKQWYLDTFAKPTDTSGSVILLIQDSEFAPSVAWLLLDL